MKKFNEKTDFSINDLRYLRKLVQQDLCVGTSTNMFRSDKRNVYEKLANKIKKIHLQLEK